MLKMTSGALSNVGTSVTSNIAKARNQFSLNDVVHYAMT